MPSPSNVTSIYHPAAHPLQLILLKMLPPPLFIVFLPFLPISSQRMIKIHSPMKEQPTFDPPSPLTPQIPILDPNPYVSIFANCQLLT